MRNIKKIVTLGCIAACAAVMLCSCGNKKALASISLASPITLQLGESKEVEITGILRDGTTVTGDELDAILKRKGMHYYTLTQSRVPYMYDKTSDWSYYVLTLFAIAKEFQASGMIRPGQKNVRQDICLAMGLPPTHIHDLAPKYQTYFGRDGRRVEFTYNDISFEIRVARVFVFPQGVAAIAPYMGQIMARPEAYTYIIDIGGYTTDVVKFSRGGQVDMTFCESFNNGVIKMYDEVQRAVRNRFQLDMDDYSIDNVLRRGYNPGREINELVHSTARSYARTLIRTLKEKGVDLTLSYPVFIGGGSCLMRPVIESELGRDDYLFVEDPRANAVGFKMMAESKLAAENR